MPDKFGDKLRLQHLLDAIATISKYVHQVDFRTFSANTMLQDACLRQLQVIGESCKNVSQELRSSYPAVPWRQIIGLRIIVIHDYAGVDEKIIWEVIQYDLPALKGQIEQILSEAL